MGGGGSAPPPPPPMSVEERTLMKKQADAIDQQSSIIMKQMKQQELLAPIMYKQFGVRPLYNAEGEIYGYADDSDPAMEEINRNNKDITLEQQRRTMKAFRGELPVDPGIERQLKLDETNLRNNLIARLGPGFETSSAGIEALANLRQRASEIRYRAARDEMTLGEQLALMGTEQLDRSNAVKLTNIMGPSNAMINFGQAYGNVAQNYGAAQQPYQAFRGAMTTWGGQKAAVDSANAAGKGQMIGAGVGAVAALGGAALIF